MRWRLPFGVVAALVGVAFLYAAFGAFPIEPAASTNATCPPSNVHLDADWTLQYRDACGTPYPAFIPALLTLITIGGTLLGGGIATVRDAV